MTAIVVVVPYLLMAVAIVQASVVGARLGARSVMALSMPWQILGVHLAVMAHPELGLETLRKGLGPTLLTMVMLLCWAVPYFHLAGRRLSPAVAVVGSIGISVVLRRLYQPWLDAIPSDTALLVATAGAPSLVVLAAWLLRLPEAEQPAEPSPVTPANVVLRVLTVWAAMALIDLDRFGTPSPVIGGLAFVAHAFPRMTLELTVGTHVAAGPVAARQVLAGVPRGVIVILVWCLGLAWLPPLLGDVAGVAVSGVLAIGWWAGHFAWWLRRAPGGRPAARIEEARAA